MLTRLRLILRNLHWIRNRGSGIKTGCFQGYRLTQLVRGEWPQAAEGRERYPITAPAMHMISLPLSLSISLSQMHHKTIHRLLKQHAFNVASCIYSEAPLAGTKHEGDKNNRARLEPSQYAPFRACSSCITLCG